MQLRNDGSLWKERTFDQGVDAGKLPPVIENVNLVRDCVLESQPVVALQDMLR